MNYLTIPMQDLLINDSLGDAVKFSPLVHFVSQRNTYTGEKSIEDVFLISLAPEKLGFFHAECEIATQDWSKAKFTDHTHDLDVVTDFIPPLKRLVEHFNIANELIANIKSLHGGDSTALSTEHFGRFLKINTHESIRTTFEYSQDGKTLIFHIMGKLDQVFRSIEHNKITICA